MTRIRFMLAALMLLVLPAAGRGGEGPPLITSIFQVDSTRFVSDLLCAAAMSEDGVVSAQVSVAPGGGSQSGFSGKGEFNFDPAMAPQIQQAIRQYFRSAGVDLGTNTGKSIAFDDGEDLLTIRATADDLETIDLGLAALTGTPTQAMDSSWRVTRVYPVYEEIFLEKLRDASKPTGRFGARPDHQEILEGFRQLLSNAGVDLGTNIGKAVFFNWCRGAVAVRATEADHEAIARTLKSLTPREVNIKAKFAEITSREGDPGFQWYLGGFKLGDTVTNNSGNQAVTNGPTVLPSGGTASAATFTGILTDPQFRAVIQALDQRDDVDVLTAPEVAAESGRQAQMQAVDIATILMNTNLDELLSPNPSTNVMLFGPSLSVIPYVSADTFSVRMTLIPSVKELSGYENPDGFTQEVLPPDGTNLYSPQPLPRYRLHQTVIDATVWDAQTALIRFPPVQVPSKTNGGPALLKTTLLFVTPTVINADGTRFHSDEEMSFVSNSPPPQARTNDVPNK